MTFSLTDHRNLVQKTKAALHADPHLVPPAEPRKAEIALVVEKLKAPGL
jgi:hypothetical protein